MQHGTLLRSSGLSSVSIEPAVTSCVQYAVVAAVAAARRALRGRSGRSGHAAFLHFATYVPVPW